MGRHVYQIEGQTLRLLHAKVESLRVAWVAAEYTASIVRKDATETSELIESLLESPTVEVAD